MIPPSTSRCCLTLLVLGCPLSALAEPARAPSPVAPVKLSAWYAPLFKEGATWTYRVTEIREWDEDAARSAGRVDARGRVNRHDRFPYDATCTASRLTAFKAGLAVQLGCTYDKKKLEALIGPRMMGPPVDSVYLATSRGLYQVGELPKSAKAFAAAISERPMLPYRPRPWSHREEQKAEGIRIEKRLSSKQVKVLGQVRTLWCAYDYYLEGDGWDSTFCFAEGIGIATSQARSINALVDATEAAVVKAP